MLKKLITSFVLFLLMVNGAATGLANAPVTVIYVNQKPFHDFKVINGQTYVHLNRIAPMLGATVNVNASNGKIRKIDVQSAKDQTTRKTQLPSNLLQPTAASTASISLTAQNATPRLQHTPLPSTPSPFLSAKVTRVVDGDTIVVSMDGQEERVRLIGVDTPETVDPNEPVQPFGKEASDYTKQRLSGQSIQLELDVDPRDRYNRLLAYVWLDGSLYNAELIENGYAILLTIPPNVKYVDRFTAMQKQARDAKRGLWAGQKVPATVKPAGTAMPAATSTHLIAIPETTVTPSVTGTPAVSTGSGKINLNTASAAQLESLPGIGPTLAQRIMEYRSFAKFQSIRDVILIKGIGESTYQKMAPFITVD